MSSLNKVGKDGERVQRKLLLKTIGIPKTTEASIIIPPNEDLNGFCRKSYHIIRILNYISLFEFNEIIDNVCKLASLAYSKKRNNNGDWDRMLSSDGCAIFKGL